MTLSPKGSWHLAATVITSVAAAGSFVLMLRAGRLQHSLILMLLYTIWVLSPFGALVTLGIASGRWPRVRRSAVDATKLLVGIASLVVYSAEVFGYLRLKAGFTFLVVPLLSWLVIAVLVLFGSRVPPG